jgi:predicted GIY-YIG superfamily endonuclease
MQDHSIGETLLYALESRDCKRSYVGVTNDFARRLRQHNGELKGGARYTRRSAAGPHWRPVFKVRGLPSRRQALQLEKLFHCGFGHRRLLKIPRGSTKNPFGGSAAGRRAWALVWALRRERFSQQETVLTRDLTLEVAWSRADFHAIARALDDWGPGTITHTTND